MECIKTTGKQKILRFVVSMSLAFVSLFNVATPALAATGAKDMKNNEIADTSLMTQNGSHWVIDESKIDNYESDVTIGSEIYQAYKNAWCNNYPNGIHHETVSDLVSDGVIIGIERDNGGTKKYIIPTTSARLSDSGDNVLITGDDALALALFYYYPSTKNGFVTYSGSSSRSDTYKNAGRYFISANGISGSGASVISDAAGRSQIQRKHVFAIIAYCIEKSSNGRVKLADYSSTKLGYMRNNKTTIHHVDPIAKTYDGHDIQDFDEATSHTGVVMQALNMLLDCGCTNGRDGDSANTCIMAWRDTCTYAEFYRMLWYTKMYIGDIEDEQTEYSDIEADLRVSATDDSISYKDFLDGERARLRVTLDASGTESRQTITSYDFSVTDSMGEEDGSSGRSSSKTYSFNYYADDLGFTRSVANKYRGECEYTIKYNGSVEVTDSLGTTETATASDSGTIEIVNYRPNAQFTAATDSLSGGIYAQQFFYTGQPITIKDYSSDYEDAIDEWHYTIKYNGGIIASSENFANAKVMTSGQTRIDSFTADAASKAHHVTFSQPGRYTITAYVIDEMGKVSNEATRTITVTGDPQPPTAIIKGNDFTYMNYNTTLTDASTDPNDDIVNWRWGEVWYFDEVLDEFDESTGEGEWINVTDKVGNKSNPDAYWNGTRKDQTRNANGSYTTATATLQFTKYGTYRIYETVTDATGLFDTGYHEITVLEDIPVIKVDEDPVPPQTEVKYTVTFINTNGNTTSVKVPAGSYVTSGQVPSIVDMPDLYEHGWTQDGTALVEPTTVKVMGNLTFVVYTTPIDENTGVHTVTFINTDGTTTVKKVPHNGNLAAGDVPGIIDEEKLLEIGWTLDGTNTVTPPDVTIDRDMVFWVLTEPIKDPDETEYPEDGLPYFDTEGRLVIKQNRSAVIDVTASLSPPNDPIQTGKTEWILEGVDGYDTGDVKFSGGKASGMKATFIAKETGEFKITITLHNNYSDQLAENRPNSSKLNARTATITVIVYPDEPPEADLYVSNANPNFHTNPSSTDVTVASSATSPDGDIIDKYDWSIIRDNNNDGEFTEKPFYTNSGSGLSTVTFPVQFKKGIVGDFLAHLKVTEASGQATLTEYMTKDDNLSTETEAQFEVNWTPCISYDLKLNGNTWAYVDDVIPITAKVLDENTSTCVVDWTLKKKVGESYIAVDTSNYEVWDFNTLGGKLRIEKDGYYVLEAVITDDHGYSETFVSNEMRVYDLPTAVISDTVKYRWLDTQWQYKQSRRFDLDGKSSYADDSTGKALHEINHSLDAWSITPISEGASAEAIYVLADDGKTRLNSKEETYFYATQNEFEEQIAIIEPGTYLVKYQVTNTYGKKSPVVSQVITIVEDHAPEIIVKDGNKQEPLGPESEDCYTTIGNMTATIRSDDQDIIYSKTESEIKNMMSARYRYDSDNDGEYEDEEWVDLPLFYSDSMTITDADTGLFVSKYSSERSAETTVKARVNELGWYQFEFQVHEQFGQETLLILPDSIYKHYTHYMTVEVDNSSPNGTFDMVNKVYGDIVFAFGGYEEGTKWIQKETARTFGEGGSEFNENYGSTSITLQPDTYTIEAWGAQGGDWDETNKNEDPDPNAVLGGNGGYVKGKLTITTPTTLYINVGGQGSKGTGSGTAGYNGGGSVEMQGIITDENGDIIISAAGGGGATTIALADGLLGKVDKSQLLMVAAGGGGATSTQSGSPANGEAVNYDPANTDRNSEDHLSAGGGGGYQAGEAGVTIKAEVSYFDEYDTRELECLKPEHEHSDKCYETENVLNCGIEIHVHDDSCHTITYETDCGLDEHEHTDDCYSGFGPFKKLDCDKTVHTHSDSCYVTDCDNKDEDHVHTAACYKVRSDEIACGKTPHEHTSACFKKQFVTECGKTEHQHTDDCPKHRKPGSFTYVYDCGYEEHSHDKSCYKTVCGYDEEHQHGIDCYKYYQHAGDNGNGGWSYVNTSKLSDVKIEDGTGSNTRTGNGYVKISSYTEEQSPYSSSDYNDELLQKNKNFANSFGEIEGANLFQLNVNTVETSTINTASASAQEILNTWFNYPGVSLGSSYQAGWTANNRNQLYTTANVGWTGFLYEGRDAYKITDATYEFTVDLSEHGQHQDPQGWTFNTTKKANGHYSFYALEIEQDRGLLNLACITDWAPASVDRSHGGPLYHGVISGGDGDYHHDGYNAGRWAAQGYIIKSVSANYNSRSVLRVKIERKGSNIAVYLNDQLQMTANDNTLSTGTFGPYTCSQWQVYFQDIVVTLGNKQTLAETLSDVSFQVGNEAFVIWSEATIPQELDKTSSTYKEDYQALIQKILDSNIHLIIFGSNTNQSVMENLLKDLPIEGTFINTGSVDGDLKEARDFIAAQLRQKKKTNVKYVLLNEESVYQKLYSDYNGHEHWYATGTEDNIYSSRWWYMQDEDYFANSLGTIDKNKTWLAEEITLFDKVGKFYVDYRVKDNAVPDAYLDDNTTNNPFGGNPDRHLTEEELAEDLRHGYRYWSSNYAGVDDLNAGFMWDSDRNVYDERLETTLTTADGDISNQPAEIFVHRRPLAESTGVATVNQSTNVLTSITISDASYDLDHNVEGHSSYTPTKGLQQYEWTYYWYEGATLKNKETKLFLNVDDGVDWINKKVSQYTYTPNTDIKVLYRVRDIDGVETTEMTTYELTLRGILYAAPELDDCADLTAAERKTANSYRYAVTSEEVDGIPAGTYVTQSYDEAIYVLKVDEEHKQKRYDTALAEYETATSVRKAKEDIYNRLEAQAVEAEALRDNQYEVVKNWKSMQETKEKNLQDAQTLLATYQTELEAAETALTNAKSELDAATTAYNTAKAAYDKVASELTSLNSNISRLTSERDTLQSQLAHLNSELSGLKNELAELEGAETPDADAITAKKSEITAKESEISAKQTSLTTKQAELDDMVAAKPGKQSEVDTAKTALDAAEAAKTSAQSACDAAQTAQTNAQNKVNSQQNVVDKATEEAESAGNRYFSELRKYNELKNNASLARKNANDAKTVLDTAIQDEANKLSAMNTAKSELDAATAKKNAVKPLTMNATVSTTQTKELTIPDGVWSVLESREYSSRPLKPIAKFVTDSITYQPGQEIKISDSSYSPNGNNIAKWTWTITRDGNTLGTKVINNTYANGFDVDKEVSDWVFSVIDKQKLDVDSAKNKYKITLVVTDDKPSPLDSDPYSVTISIVPENHAPEVNPGSSDSNIYKQQNPIVYEYDAYDANMANAYYTYNGKTQYRGTETLDWSLILSDPDNSDKYGTANDTNTYTVDYLFERFTHQGITTVLDNSTTNEKYTYGPYNVTASQALTSSNLAPFTTVKNGNVTWGAYRITTTVTDNPLNGMDKKSTSIITNPDKTPKHLYVVPKLTINDTHYIWEDLVDTEEQIPVGDTIEVTFATNNEVTSVYTLMPDGEGGTVRTAGTVASVDKDGTKHWSIFPVIPDTLEEDDLVNGKGYTFKVEINTNYGSLDGETIMRTKYAEMHMNVLAIKLYNFHITNVTDPAVKYDTSTSVYVPDLAYDETNSPAGELMKKGYSFYFELSSMGLKGDNDTVRITPSFYAKGADGRYYEVDVWYRNSDGEYVLGTYSADSSTTAKDTFRMYAKGQSGSLLGTMRELILDGDDRTMNGKEQIWTGRYGLPSTAVFVKKGAELSKENLVSGEILITFNLEAMKNGVSKYDYIGRGQWHLERVNDNGTYINAAKAHYMDGSVIVIDGDNDATSNYDSLPVWRKS